MHGPASTSWRPRSHGKPLLTAPGARAVFDFALTAPGNLTALFNTRAAAVEDAGDGLIRTLYERTPRMSTYLVAFVVGNLTNVSTSVPGQDPFAEPRRISVWGTPDRWAGLDKTPPGPFMHVKPSIVRYSILFRASHSGLCCGGACWMSG